MSNKIYHGVPPQKCAIAPSPLSRLIHRKVGRDLPKVCGLDRGSLAYPRCLSFMFCPTHLCICLHFCESV